MRSMFKKINQYLKSFKKIDILGFSFFLIVLFLSVFFLLRRAKYVYVTLRISTEDNLHNQWWIQPSNWYLENLEEGLVDKDLTGKTNAVLEDIYFYPRSEAVQDLFITLKLEATFNEKLNQYSYKGAPLLIGSYQKIEIAGFSIRGMVQKISSEYPEKEMRDFVVKAKLKPEDNASFFTNSGVEYHGVENHLANALEEGLVSYDSEGAKIVEIKEIEKKSSYKTFVSPLTNKLVSVYDPERQIVNLEMIIKQTKVYEGEYAYREDTPITVGSLIPLYFDGVTVYATVTEMEELSLDS